MALWNNTNPEPTGDTVWSDEDKYRGQSATITIGSVESVEQGEESITNVGSPTDAVLNFKLPIGNTGEQGIQGNAGTITIGTVSTGDAGTDVIIENVGSPNQAVLNITIPRGVQGVAGSKGWSPVFAVITDGVRKVLKVSDWQGGEGTKPVVDVYMGVAGYTYILADAVDIRGATGDTGATGVGVPSGGTANQVVYKVDGTDYSTGWKTLTKADVGLSNVDNTADTAKPVSTAQQTALNAKQATLVSGTNIKTVNNVSLLGSGNIPVDSGKYACSVWKEGNSTTPITGTVNGYNAVWHNDGQLNTTTGVYTVPVSGLYKVEFDAIKHNNNTATEIRLFKNGSATGVRSWMDSTTSGEYETGHISIMGNFNAGDTLDIRVTVGGVHGNESCYLNIHKVR